MSAETMHAVLAGAEEALGVLDDYLASWKAGLADAPDQLALHAYAWTATYVRALRELHAWGSRLHRRGAFGDLEQRLLRAGFGEYLAQIRGGFKGGYPTYGLLLNLLFLQMEFTTWAEEAGLYVGQLEDRHYLFGVRLGI